jgi:GWxTD domain-containing protein
MQDETVMFEQFVRSLGRDSATVDIFFRFRKDFFVFTRQADGPKFSAMGDVTIEILDSTDNSISRHIQSFTMVSDDNALPILREQYWQGFATFRLPRGRSTALCSVTDKESGHKQFQMRLPLMMHQSRAAVSSPLLVQSFDAVAGIVPCNYGGNAFFSSPLFVAAALTRITPPLQATYSLTRSLYDDEEHVTYQGDTTVPAIVLPKTRLVPMLDSTHTVIYRFEPDSVDAVGVVELPGELMPQGRYTLRIRFGGPDTASLRTGFAMRWIGMPQSLRDLDFATAAMKYITTEDEYDKLRSGRLASRVQAFENFWKKLDPTPGTAFNERLAEYFRRVDHAYTAFRTLKDDNGITTDRGKIYILYGAPAAHDRVLSPSNAPREVWRYPALKKTFTFEDSSRQGNYQLIQSDTQ